MSLMRRHQQAVQNGMVVEQQPRKATGVIAVVPTGFMAERQLLTQLTSALREDFARLSALQSVERKQDLKRDELIPKYAPYVERLKREGQQHELLGWYLVWLFDAGEIEHGMAHALWCIDNGVTLPEKFRRDVPTYVADAVADWAKPLVAAGQSVSPYLSDLVHVADGLCRQWDIPDAVSANLLKLHGDACAASERWELAVEAYEAAFELGASVKTVLDKARKQLAKAAQ
ncbi:phage terminase small subunit [Desulfovibrio subterraneus]|uniref:Terminase n=1 Tax=Desulfovibrio subterraneus TaxID=2718620 RepID=A0A7J0BMF7_9BACT|nr:phage terminase small subunit [Desulfovibrio subterraneus]GFM34214.1 hypothetical protein DSM101010T_25790 [Desulfovibrio subterraneus]